MWEKKYRSDYDIPTLERQKSWNEEVSPGADLERIYFIEKFKDKQITEDEFYDKLIIDLRLRYYYDKINNAIHRSYWERWDEQSYKRLVDANIWILNQSIKSRLKSKYKYNDIQLTITMNLWVILLKKFFLRHKKKY